MHENYKLKPGENMLCTEIVSAIQNNFCAQYVLPMFCKKRASDKDLPVQWNVVVKRYRDLKSESPGKDNDD